MLGQMFFRYFLFCVIYLLKCFVLFFHPSYCSKVALVAGENNYARFEKKTWFNWLNVLMNDRSSFNFFDFSLAKEWIFPSISFIPLDDNLNPIHFVLIWFGQCGISLASKELRFRPLCVVPLIVASRSSCAVPCPFCHYEDIVNERKYSLFLCIDFSRIFRSLHGIIVIP